MTAADGDRMYDPLPDGAWLVVCNLCGAVVHYGDLHRAAHADPARLDDGDAEGGR